MLDSGLCQTFEDVETGEIAGAGIHCAWRRDPEYQVSSNRGLEMVCVFCANCGFLNSFSAFIGKNPL